MTAKLFVPSGKPDQDSCGDRSSPPAPITPLTCGVASGSPWVQSELARTYAKLEAMRLMNWKMTTAVASGDLTGATAGAAKTYGTETHIDVQRTLTQVLGAAGRIRPESPGAVLHGQVEQLSRQGIVNTVGGGVNDILRDMVATQGLGLPRAGR